jgi:membrane-associated phospholipid phosphatase
MSILFALMVWRIWKDGLFTRTKKLWPFLMLLAFTKAFEWVYAGNHSPSDVFTGAIIGTLCAFPPTSHYLKKKRTPPEKN